MPPRHPLLAPLMAVTVAVLIITCMWWLSGVFVPLGLGLLVAWVLAPAVDRLQRLVGTRARAAALLLLGSCLAATACLAAAVPIAILEAQHWRHAVTGEGTSAQRLGTKTIEYADFADPDATTWDKAALLAAARTRAAPTPVLLVLGALPAPDPQGELTLGDAVGDRDGDGRIDPGYLKRLRVLAADRSSWLGAAWSQLERSGVLREVDRAWRKSTSRDQLRKLLAGSPALSTAGDYGLKLLETIGDAVSSALGVALGIVLVPVYAFFFLGALPRWRERLPAYLPRADRERWLRILHRVGAAVSGFVRGRLVVCAVVGIVTAAGWALLGVRAGFLAGLLVGVLTVIPFANILIFVPILLMALLDLGAGVHGPGWLAGVIAVYALGQALDSVLNPIVVGDAVQVDVVTMIVALLIGGTVAGFFGLLVAVPVAATLRILLDELILPKWQRWAEGAESP